MQTQAGYLGFLRQYNNTLRMGGSLAAMALPDNTYMDIFKTQGQQSLEYLINDGLHVLRVEIRTLRISPHIPVKEKDLVMSYYKVLEAMREAVRLILHRLSERYDLPDDNKSILSYQSSAIVRDDQTASYKVAVTNQFYETMIDYAHTLLEIGQSRVPPEESSQREKLFTFSLRTIEKTYMAFLQKTWIDNRRYRQRDYRTPHDAERQRLPTPNTTNSPTATPRVPQPTGIRTTRSILDPTPLHQPDQDQANVAGMRGVHFNSDPSHHVYTPPPPLLVPPPGTASAAGQRHMPPKKGKRTTNADLHRTNPRRQNAANMDNAFNQGQNTSGPTAPPSTIGGDQNVSNAELSRMLTEHEGSMADMATIARAALALSLNKSSADSSSNAEYKEKALPGDQKRLFYNSLPEPWNEQPERDGKYNDEFNKIKLLVSEAGKEGSRIERFDGTESKYYNWRPIFINVVHNRNVSIKDKYDGLMQLLKRNCDTVIDGLLSEANPTPENYRAAIETLEMNYGGTRRAFTHAVKKLKMGKKLDLNDFDSVTDYHGVVKQFVNFCKDNKLVECLKPGLSAAELIKGFMTNHQIEQMFLFCSSQGINQPNGSMFQVEAFLLRLSSISRNARELIGWQRLPSQRAKNTFPDRRNTGPNRRTTFMSAHAGQPMNEPMVSSSSAEGGNQAESDNEENSNADQTTSSYEKDNIYMHEGNDPNPVQEPPPCENVPVLEEGDTLEDGMITHDSEYRLITMMGRFKMPDCPLCPNQKHMLFRCEVFKKASFVKRFNIIKKSNRCFNCLGMGHGVRSCTSNSRCQNCRRAHHTLICEKNAIRPEDKKFLQELTTAQKQLCSTNGEKAKST